MDGQSLTEFLSLPVKPDETWQGGVAKLSDLMGIPPEEAPSQIGADPVEGRAKRIGAC